MIGQGLFPNQSAQGFGDFTGGGFVREGVGVEAINGQVLQGFAGEGRGERWFAAMGGLFRDFGMEGGGGTVPCLVKFGIGEQGKRIKSIRGVFQPLIAKIINSRPLIESPESIYSGGYLLKILYMELPELDAFTLISTFQPIGFQYEKRSFSHL